MGNDVTDLTITPQLTVMLATTLFEKRRERMRDVLERAGKTRLVTPDGKVLFDLAEQPATPTS